MRAADAQRVPELIQVGGRFQDGFSIVVEVDETKMAKVKYHRGHPVDGGWVLGGVERTPDRNLFLLEVPVRNRQTITAALQTYIRPGSTIVTDFWRGYSTADIEQMGCSHQTVNHRNFYRDPITGACTNTIEGS